MCGGHGKQYFTSKKVDDTSKILYYRYGYIPIYAQKPVCKRCGYEERWHEKRREDTKANGYIHISGRDIFKYLLKPKDIIKPKDSHYDILLIEDDLTTIRLLTSYFKSKGVVCKAVLSGKKGLEELDLLENNPPKVILLKIILPDSSGYDICKKIKSNQKLKNIPVLFFTAIPGSEVEKFLGETKADAYILKPFDFSDFDIILDLLNPQKNTHESIPKS